MNAAQWSMSRLMTGQRRSHGAQSLQRGSPAHGAGQILREEGESDPRDDATERLANIAAYTTTGRPLQQAQKARAGTLIHYGFSVGTGALYGALAEISPVVTAGRGIPFGLAVWLGADEGIVPALGLSKRPTRYSRETHAYSIAAHAIFGLTTEITRRLLGGRRR